MSEAPNGLMRGTVAVDLGEGGKKGSFMFAAEHYVPRPGQLTLRAGATRVVVNEGKCPPREDRLRYWAFGVLTQLNLMYRWRYERGRLRREGPETSGTSGYVDDALFEIFVRLSGETHSAS